MPLAARGLRLAYGAMPAVGAGRAASLADRPLSGLLGIDKPSGPTSMDLLDRLKPLLASSSLFYAADEKRASQDRRRLKPWEKALQKKCGGRLPPKLGQGGTLDPLAEGVLVIGIGAATKQLSQFLHCSKEYETTGLLGTSTTSYDSQEPVMCRAPHAHVDEALVRSQLPRFTGAVKQLPPVFSALRMDGKRLFEYAREGLPLPRPIEPRDVTVHELRLVAWHAPDAHAYEPPTGQGAPAGPPPPREAGPPAPGGAGVAGGPGAPWAGASPRWERCRRHRHIQGRRSTQAGACCCYGCADGGTGACAAGRIYAGHDRVVWHVRALHCARSRHGVRERRTCGAPATHTSRRLFARHARRAGQLPAVVGLRAGPQGARGGAARRYLVRYAR